VTNFPKAGFLSHEALSRHRRDLVTVRVMGWNDGGQALDYTVNAALGVPGMTGSAANGDTPVNHVLPAWDLLTGSYAAFALLAAERHRRLTGQGQEVLVPLSDVAVASLGHMGQIAEVLAGGDRPRYGNDLFGAFGRDFTSADGQRVMVVAITARQWSGLVGALQLGPAIAAVEAARGVSFALDEGLRFEHRDALFPLFEQAIGALPLAALQPAFDAAGVCWSPYRTLRRALDEDPHFDTRRDLFTTLDHPSGHRYPAPGAMGTFTGLPRQPVQRAPRLGEHTDEVLAELLSLSAAQIGELHDAGLVAGADKTRDLR
jgi:2-methylfumaryl-CoA isomerase